MWAIRCVHCKRAECEPSAHLEKSKVAAVPLLPQRLAHHDVVDREQILTRFLYSVMLSAAHAHAQTAYSRHCANGGHALGTCDIACAHTVGVCWVHVIRCARILWAGAVHVGSARSSIVPQATKSDAGFGLG